MAFIDCEGFDLLASGSLEPSGMWIQTPQNIGSPGVFSYGQYGSGVNSHTIAYLPGQFSTIFANFHIYIPGSGDNATLFYFREGSNYQVSLGQAGSKWRLFRSNNVTLGTGASTIVTSSWYFVQMKVVVHDSAGSIHLKIGGATELNLTGIDTMATSNAWVDQWGFGPSVGNNIRFDNVVFYDATGLEMNDFTPETRVFGQFPSGAGALSEWTPSAGSNYENVNENYDGDTTYNSAATSGLRDLYAYPSPVPAGTAVYAVKAHATFRKDDVGDNACNVLVRSGSTNYQCPTGPFQSLGSYLYHDWNMVVDPNTGLTWTVSAANAVQSGIIRTT